MTLNRILPIQYILFCCFICFSISTTSAMELDKSHTTIDCNECHSVTPVTTNNAKQFVSGSLDSLCSSCHQSNTENMLNVATTTVIHNSFVNINSEQQNFYVNWLDAYNEQNGTTLTGFRLIDNGDGSFSTSCLSCHNIHGRNIFPDIPMENAEICIACHGGHANYDPNVIDNVYSSMPRILYNPQHLGVQDTKGNQFPAPSDPAYNGQPPRDGDTVSGNVPIPVSFFFRFHTNIAENLNYHIDMIGPYNESYIETDSRPLSWYTAINSISRWPNEKAMFQWNTDNVNPGAYEVRMTPYNPMDETDISALVLNLEVQGALNAIEMIQQLLALVESLNLHAGIDNSLDAKLEAAQQALSDLNQANDIAAINTLETFTQAVEAQSGKKISIIDADMLITAATEIIAFLNG